MLCSVAALEKISNKNHKPHRVPNREQSSRIGTVLALHHSSDNRQAIPQLKQLLVYRQSNNQSPIQDGAADRSFSFSDSPVCLFQGPTAMDILRGGIHADFCHFLLDRILLFCSEQRRQNYNDVGYVWRCHVSSLSSSSSAAECPSSTTGGAIQPAALGRRTKK